MAVPVIMPKFEMSQETATVVEWLKQEGDEVKKGEPLLTVETDKVTMDVEVPASGILKDIRVEPQQIVPVTEVIAYILEPGEELPEILPSFPPTSFDSAQDKRGEEVLERQGGRATPVAQRLAAAHSVDLGAVIGTGTGGRIIKADVEAAMVAPAERMPEGNPGKVRATPAARRVARERDMDLATIPGSGPRSRVQVGDVLAMALTPIPAPDLGRGEPTVVSLQGIRRTIAERMTTSYQTAPHITLTVQVDIGAFEETRAQLNAKAEADGLPRVSVTVLLVKAVAWALRRHPWLNSTLRGDEIHLLPEINVGVAVALEAGLIVPVVCGADRKGVAEIAVEVQDLIARAREGCLMPVDVAEGTFTLSNLGPFGIELFTAIINPPQAAILAVGAARREAVVGPDDEVVVRPILWMTLSVDHRIVDGAVAARFLADLREVLKSPALLLW
jgi:pyruvate dehydrogenase E2 component (dihydrolipoamide acetyltransferase)